jgi:8-oxo-dGTP pyrophosphatase MutT (NUDIX family)
MPSPAKFAVAVIVLRHNEAVEGKWECLLVARKDDATRWSLPGGKVDQGETSRLAAHRELYEETGIHLGYLLLNLPDTSRLIPQETVLDSGGYFTTFYLVDTTGLKLPDEPKGVGDGEAPARWGSVYELLDGPYGRENAERLRKIGVIP